MSSTVFSYAECVLSQKSVLFLLLLICGGYPNNNSQGGFVTIFFICSDLFNCLRSLCAVEIRTVKLLKQHQKHFHKEIPHCKQLFLTYLLYDYPKNFNFKPKYQQYGPCFQTIVPFFYGYDETYYSNWSFGIRTAIKSVLCQRNKILFISVSNWS